MNRPDAPNAGVLYSFPHALGRAGIATTAYHQLEGAIAQGISVDLWCTSVARPLPGASAVTETLLLGGRRVPHRALGVERAYRYHDRRVARSLRRGDVRVVHCWPAACVHTFAAARAVGVRALREVPSAFTRTAYEVATAEAESLGIELPPGHSHRFDERRLARELQEFAAADVLLVPSAYVEQTFRDEGFDGKLVRHQYGYDPNRYSPDPDWTPNDSDGLRVLFVGHGAPHKGLHYALRAWLASGAAERGRFVICGQFLPEYERILSPQLEHPSVEVRGFVSDVAAEMRAADVFVLPSVTEGSALVTYEARGSGCVLVVSDATGAPCDDGRTGLVHRAGDEATLTAQLAELDRDRALLDRLRTASVAEIGELTWEAAGVRLASIYADEAARADG